MLRFSLTPEQLGRMRFAVSPMVHLVGLLRRMHRGKPLPAWIRRSWAALDRERMTPLVQMVPPGCRYIPDLLTPLPPCADPSIDDELHAVESTDEEVLRVELSSIYRLGPLNELYAVAVGVTPQVADSWRVTPPRAIQDAYERNAEAFLAALSDSTRYVWDQVLAPRWPQIRRIARADVAFRAQQAAAAGPYRAVLGLGDVRHWDAETIAIDTPATIDLTEWHGQIVFSPMVFLDDGPTTCASGCDVLVAYPCRGRADVLGEAGTDRGHSTGASGMAGVIGSTRVRLLELLDEPRPGHVLAGRLGVSAPTVSYHLARLRRGGLVEGIRLGREILYVRTAKAERLTAGAPRSG